jgi:putative ABC transport system permease protein
MEEWKDNSSNEEATMRVYFEPDFEKYTRFGDSVKVTKVLDSTHNSSGTLKDVRVMGINTKEFGEIAWFRNGLLPAHWFEYLNTMATDARAVLVSMNFHTMQGYDLGDTISIRSNNGNFFTGINLRVYRLLADILPDSNHHSARRHRKGHRPVACGGQSGSGTVGVGVDSLRDLDENRLKPVYLQLRRGAGPEIQNLPGCGRGDRSEKNDPVLQGTNGVLTVGFIIILLVCMTGFLIYWILSIRSRVLQFGIFRAMGLSMKSILHCFSMSKS